MAVADIMTRSLITVRPEDNIEVMRRLLREHPIHHLLVVENECLLGVISDRDILKTLSPFIGTKVESEKDAFTLTRKAQQIMSRRLITIAPNANIQQAAKKFIEHNVSLLPVVNDEQKPVGVLSWKDVLKFLIS